MISRFFFKTVAPRLLILGAAFFLRRTGQRRPPGARLIPRRHFILPKRGHVRWITKLAFSDTRGGVCRVQNIFFFQLLRTGRADRNQRHLITPYSAADTAFLSFNFCFWKHPQDFVLPAFRLQPRTKLSLPQSQRQRHRRSVTGFFGSFRGWYSPARSTTVSLPKRWPDRFSRFFMSYPPVKSLK